MKNSTFEASSRIALIGMSLICFLIVVVNLLMSAVGTDEAWTLLSAEYLAQSPAFADQVINPIVATSGGLYAFAHALLSIPFPGDIAIHRAVSLLCLVGTGSVVVRALRNQGFDWTEVLLALAFLLAAPGVLIFGGVALAEPVALFLFVLLVIHLETLLSQNKGAILAGIILGAMIATRLNCILFIPALALWSVLIKEQRRQRLTRMAMVIAVGIIVYLLLTKAYVELAGVESNKWTPKGTGFIARSDYPFLMNKWIVGEQLAPLAISITATLAVVVYMAHYPGPLANLMLLLVLSFWFQWVGWVLRSPIPHLRYMWPGLPGLWLSIGLMVMVAFRLAKEKDIKVLRVSALLLGILVLGNQILISGRHTVLGDLDIVTWEWSGETAMDYFRRFTYGPEQKQFAREVSIRVPAEEPIGVIVKGYPLRYLSGARVISLPQLVSESGGWSAAEHLPKWMALTSEVGDYRFLRPEAHSWFKDNTKLEVQVGKNALYRVTGPYPEKPLVLLSIQEPLAGHPLARDSFGAYRWGDSGYNSKAKSGPRQ